MSARLHRQDARKLLIGLAAVGVAGVIAYVGTLVQGGGALPLAKHTDVTAYFTSVGTLKPQQNVTENGIRVGVVTGISYDKGAAKVNMRLDGNRAVYADAKASIGNASVLGRKFVAIDPGTPSAGLLGGKPIAQDHTTSSTDLNTVLSAFTPAARQGLQTGLQNLGGGMAGHSDDLYSAVQAAPQLMNDGTLVLGTVSSPSTDLSGLLSTADTLVARLQGHEQQISNLIETTGSTLNALNVDGTQPLRDTIAQAPETLATARAGLASINPALVRTADAVTRLRPGINDLVAAVPNLRGFLVESPPVAVTVRSFATTSVQPVASLIPALNDVTPAVGHLRETLSKTEPTLSTLSPYAADAGTLFCENDLLSGNYGPDKHYFSAMLVFPGIYNVSLPDPLAQMDSYPGPGRAFSEGLAYGKGKC